MFGVTPGEEKCQHRIVRRVLNGVEERIAEVRVIVHTVTGAEDGALIPSHIPRETGARGEVIPVLVEEVACTLEASIANLIEEALPPGVKAAVVPTASR